MLNDFSYLFVIYINFSNDFKEKVIIAFFMHFIHFCTTLSDIVQGGVDLYKLFMHLYSQVYDLNNEITFHFSSPGRMSGELLSYHRRRRRRVRPRAQKL